jgi:chromosome segregation ATPase
MDRIQIAHVDNYLQAYIDERIKSEQTVQDLESRINALSKDLAKAKEDLNRCKIYSEKVKSELSAQVSEMQGEILFSFFGYTIHAH